MSLNYIQKAPFLFILLFTPLSFGCYGTAAGDCEIIAEVQCDLWTECKCTGENGEESCQQDIVFTSKKACQTEVNRFCRSQASSLNKIDKDTGDCRKALESFTCAEMRANVAQKRIARPAACYYFY